MKISSLPFFLATLNRSGSHFLMGLLNSTKQIGQVRGYIDRLHIEHHENNPDLPADSLPDDSRILSFFEEIIQKVGNRSTTGIWGARISIRQLKFVKRWIELKRISPQSIKWIWLRRRDKAAQAVSLVRAMGSTIFGISTNDPNLQQKLEESNKIKMSIADLYKHICHFYIAEEAWCNFFAKHSITPHAIFYEDFVEASTWETTIAGIFDFLGVSYTLPFNISESTLKQATGDLPPSYITLRERIRNLGIPLEYTPAGFCLMGADHD